MEFGSDAAWPPSFRERLRLRLLHLGFLVTRPMSLGVRGIVITAGDEVLLVRHGYVSGWHFPGGGVEVGETCVESRDTRARGGSVHRDRRAACPARALLQHANLEARPRGRLCGPELPGPGRTHARLGNRAKRVFSLAWRCRKERRGPRERGWPRSSIPCRFPTAGDATRPAAVRRQFNPIALISSHNFGQEDNPLTDR